MVSLRLPLSALTPQDAPGRRGGESLRPEDTGGWSPLNAVRELGQNGDALFLGLQDNHQQQEMPPPVLEHYRAGVAGTSEGPSMYVPLQVKAKVEGGVVGIPALLVRPLDLAKRQL